MTYDYTAQGTAYTIYCVTDANFDDRDSNKKLLNRDNNMVTIIIDS